MHHSVADEGDIKSNFKRPKKLQRTDAMKLFIDKKRKIFFMIYTFCICGLTILIALLINQAFKKVGDKSKAISFSNKGTYNGNKWNLLNVLPLHGLWAPAGYRNLANSSL